MAVLRRSILTGLAEAAVYNINRGIMMAPGREEEWLDHVDAIARVADENSGATDDMRGSLAVQVDAMERMVKQATRLTETSDRLEEVARRFRSRCPPAAAAAQPPGCAPASCSCP